MDMLNTSLFASPIPAKLGVGFHNVGSGVLRASNEAIVSYVEHHYGERCGHLPLEAERLAVLVVEQTEDIRAQMDYLGQLYGKTITPYTLDELRAEKERAGVTPQVVPYINVPETEKQIGDALDTRPWGLPGTMTHALKNKANFYQLAGEFELEGFQPPDYRVSSIYELERNATAFLAWIEELYNRAGVAGSYALGVMMRFAESDGNYGCCLVYEHAAGIVLVPNGDAEQAQFYSAWHDALVESRRHLLATMNTQKEERIVLSRYIDFLDSPGMSVVILNGHVESLGWNGQLQKEGSKACVGTSTYQPKNAFLRRAQQQYEAQTADFFEAFLRATAKSRGIDFDTIRGVANIDIMIPGEVERALQRSRKQPQVHYLAECNPRWTNYTDAIMAVLGAQRMEQSVATMRAVIQAGICSIDKYPLPGNLDPRVARERLAEKDEMLKKEGTRVICRMTQNPLGLIFAGDLERAEQAVQETLVELSATSGV